MGRIARRLFVVAGLVLAVGQACISPPLPLPPPAEPEVTATGEEGMVLLSGHVPQPRAWVSARNLSRIDTGDTRAIGGDRADERGDYAFEIRGYPGDYCVLWYEYADDESQTRDFEIPDPVPGP